MNTYIQDKLDEFDKSELSERIRASEMFAINHGFKPWMGITLLESIQSLLTDYHNHIVEKLHNQVESMYDPEQWEFYTCVNFVNTFVENISLLQDTNPNE